MVFCGKLVSIVRRLWIDIVKIVKFFVMYVIFVLGICKFRNKEWFIYMYILLGWYLVFFYKEIVEKLLIFRYWLLKGMGDVWGSRNI